jgi:hypothetical protein
MRIPPWLMPLGMGLWNVGYFVATFLFEGRVKANVARYAVLYLASVPPAMRGDLSPFYLVLSGGMD